MPAPQPSGQTVTALQGEALDGLVWRTTGLGPEVLAAVLELNPGLAGTPQLGAGQRVLLPVLPTRSPVRETIQLWS